jgi:hypothetical protein
MWKRLGYREENKETQMCGGQPSLVPYLFLERKGGHKMIEN